MLKSDYSQCQKWYLPNSGIWNERYLEEKKNILDEKRDAREAAIIERYIPKGSSILDTPCGYGRLSNRLASHGFKVSGVDINRFFVDRARENAEKLKLPVNYFTKDLFKFRPTQKYDAVINIFTSIGYLETENKNNLLIKKICEWVKPAGVLIIETMNPYWLLKNYKAEEKVVTSNGTQIYYQRHYDWERAINVTEIAESKDNKKLFSGATLIRLYFPHELINLCGLHGLRLKTSLNEFGGKNNILDSRRIWLIFNKKR